MTVVRKRSSVLDPLFAIVVVLAALGLACSGHRGEGEGSWRLFRALHAARGLALVTAEPDLAEELRTHVAVFRGSLPLDTQVVSEAPRGFARVLFKRLDDPELPRLTAGWPIAFGPDGPRLEADAPLPLDGPRDAFRLTCEDPERPGLPLNVVCGGAEVPLAELVDLLRPSWRPGLLAWRDGHALAFAAGVDAERVRLLEEPREFLPVVGSPIACRRSPAVGAEDARAYTEAVLDSFERLRRWSPRGGQTTPVGPVVLTDRPLGILPPVLSEAGSAPASGSNEPAGKTANRRGLRPLGSPLAVHELLADPDDGALGPGGLGAFGDRASSLFFPRAGAPALHDSGAAAVSASLRARFGRPAEPWLGTAMGVAVGGTWWGEPLEETVVRLGRSGALPSFDELFDPLARAAYSVHELSPLRAFALWLHFQNEAGSERLADATELWREGFDEEARARLADVYAQATRALFEAGPEATQSVPERPYRGLFVRGTETLEDLEPFLERVARSGADTVAIEVLVALDAPPFRQGLPVASGASASDAQLLRLFTAARVKGLRPALVLSVLAAPTSTTLDRVSRILPRDWEELFQRFVPLVSHYANVARLGDCELFCIASELGKLSDLTKLEGDARKREAKRVGWQSLMARAQALFDETLVASAVRSSTLKNDVFATYFPVLAVPSLPMQQGPAENAAVLRGKLRNALQKLAKEAQSAGKPLLLLPWGAPACEASEARGEHPVPLVDELAQERVFDALGEVLDDVWAQSWFGGAFVWYAAPPETTRPTPWGFQVFGRPAEDRLPRLFAR